MKKIILAATAPVVLTACVEPNSADIAAAFNQCQMAGINPQLPAHAICVEKLVEDNEDRAAQIQIGTAVAGLVLTGIGTIAALTNPVVYY